MKWVLNSAVVCLGVALKLDNMQELFIFMLCTILLPNNEGNSMNNIFIIFTGKRLNETKNLY